ncbi:hypothetical protein [Sphingomonas sp. dw_22]|uniref:hypothetical protein n=1 Tax=Sphingomonas sp. dw_22 TaxID=2721175 RepID=UPI001BD66388|nr:hypothetical protein [Sphingomonas sp. dw_22]
MAGKRIRGATYLHRSALQDLPATEQARVEAAASATGATWNVVRVAREEISLLDYADFDEDPFPSLHASALVRDDGHVVARDYSARSNPPILHRKELLVGEDHPLRADWAETTVRLVKAGAFSDPHRIGTRDAWRRRLEELSIDEFGRVRQ